MKLATANYSPERPETWDSYVAKSESWVRSAADAGAELLVFPEYAGVEAAMAVTFGALDAGGWCRASADVLPRFLAFWRALADRFGVHILTGSLPAPGPGTGGLVNRAHLFAPGGHMGFQDKQILTPWERGNTPLSPGEPLTVFDTALGRIGVLVCYDCEFPLLARAQPCDLLLVPSSTKALAGLTRVHLGARARALEGQCYAAVATLTGPMRGCELMDMNTGRAGVFSPPDRGFPPEGLVALGELDKAAWVIAEIDIDGLAETRKTSEVDVPGHWGEQRRAADPRANRPVTVMRS